MNPPLTPSTPIELYQITVNGVPFGQYVVDMLNMQAKVGVWLLAALVVMVAYAIYLDHGKPKP